MARKWRRNSSNRSSAPAHVGEAGGVEGVEDGGNELHVGQQQAQLVGGAAGAQLAHPLALGLRGGREAGQAGQVEGGLPNARQQIKA